MLTSFLRRLPISRNNLRGLGAVDCGMWILGDLLQRITHHHHSSASTALTDKYDLHLDHDRVL